jgi:transposase
MIRRAFPVHANARTPDTQRWSKRGYQKHEGRTNDSETTMKKRDTLVLRLHSAGLSDRETAGKLGLSISTICRDRARLGLAPNGFAYIRGPKKWHEKAARQLHGRGLNDRQIAQVLGVSRETISRWRRLSGLARNGRPGRQPSISANGED